MQYEIIRSKRRTCSIQVKYNGSVIVRAPVAMPEHLIEQFVKEKYNWIKNSLRKVADMQEAADSLTPVSEISIEELKEKARSTLPEKVEYYAQKIGVTYGKITVRAQKTRWGSCSSAGNLNFNCLLMLMPDYVINYVVIHELCHRKQMNHSSHFWNEVKKAMPDYEKAYRWLKINGSLYMKKYFKNQG